MATASTVGSMVATDRTVADLLADLGDVDPGRILLHPPLGTATVADLERINGERRSIYELVDGVLVEKGMGVWESGKSILALTLARFLTEYVAARNLGFVSGADGHYRLETDDVLPDLALPVARIFEDVDQSLD